MKEVFKIIKNWIGNHGNKAIAFFTLEIFVFTLAPMQGYTNSNDVDTRRNSNPVSVEQKSQSFDDTSAVSTHAQDVKTTEDTVITYKDVLLEIPAGP